jgi:hypothetical protein
MSSLQQIESLISGLSLRDRAKLVRDLPALLPEWEAELAWQRIHRDPSPSEALSSFVDGVDAEFRRDPEAFPKIKHADFERNS